MSKQFDMAVIGAGLAGSCTAILAAQSGARVVLLESDTPGRHKVCGEFLSPESRVQLQRLGVLDALYRAGAHDVSTARISTSTLRGRPIALPGPGLAISRATLDSVLWQRAIEVGVEARSGTRVARIERTPSGDFTLETASGPVRATYIVSATGRNSKWGRDGDKDDETPKAKHRFIGLKTHLRGVRLSCGEVALFPFDGGYCGLVEVEGGHVNACLLAPYARIKNSSPEALWQELLRENRALSEAIQDAEFVFPWKATGNVSFSRFAPARDGIVRTGDAAGYIHPLSGDGMAMALRSGELAARTVQQGLRCHYSPDEVARLYAVLWQREFGNRLQWAGALQPLFCDTRLSNAALRIVSWFPRLSRIAAQRTRGQVLA